jgi:hypothetical protein
MKWHQRNENNNSQRSENKIMAAKLAASESERERRSWRGES